jgi:nitroreductase
VIVPWHSLVLDETIRERHSTRMFLPQSVPRALVDESLALAQRASSSSDIQPWYMVFASGPARDRLVAALLREARRGPPKIPPLPESFRHYRRDLAAQVYGAMGIALDDTANHAAAVLRNWEFFGAPLVGIVCMHRDLGPEDTMSVGMYLQTLLLALTETRPGYLRGSLGRGVSRNRPGAAGYPGGIVECGPAVGYPDPDFPANRLGVSRESIGKDVVFVDR